MVVGSTVAVDDGVCDGFVDGWIDGPVVGSDVVGSTVLGDLDGCKVGVLVGSSVIGAFVGDLVGFDEDMDTEVGERVDVTTHGASLVSQSLLLDKILLGQQLFCPPCRSEQPPCWSHSSHDGAQQTVFRKYVPNIPLSQYGS